MLDILTPEQDLLYGLSQHQPRNMDGAISPDTLTEDDRWIAASTLQKAIRQGHVTDALYAAQVLHRLNPSHLWNRLAVIALEDVGLANINLAAQVLWVAGKQKWRLKHRGDVFIFGHLIPSLCASPKSRALDDSLYACEYHPLYQEQRQQYEVMAEDELYAAFFDKGLDVIERVLICRYLCGARYRSDKLKLQKRNPDIMFQLADNIGTPPHITDLMKLSKSQEYFTCLLPCAIHMEHSRTSKTVDDTDGTTWKKIGPYPVAAYDRHTRPGKKSYRQFLLRCEPVAYFIRIHCPKANPVDLVGWAIFILEGQHLNKRIVYDGSETLRDLAGQAWLCKGGMPIDIQEDFISLVGRYKNELYEARCRISPLMSSIARKFLQ